jgi:hypothetical protein
MKKHNLIVSVFASFFLFFCTSEKELEKTFELPKSLKEISGIGITSKSDAIWAIADSGNENELFKLGPNGGLDYVIRIKNAENKDWEDLTSDNQGNIYIGDFGNNKNTRTDLCIYKIDKDSLNNTLTEASYKIEFSYPEQTYFPPKKTKLLYDVEAFIAYKNHFYLFTKNRSKNFDGTTLLYKVPNAQGNHKATLIGSYKTGEDYNNGAITGAALSPDETKIALLSHSKIWLIENFKDDAFLNGKITKIDLGHYSQKEAITFKGNTTILIADEKVKKSGGNVYQYKLPK